MRDGITFTLDAADRRRLVTLVEDRNTPQKHVWRARIVLMSADGISTHAIMTETCTAKTTVWRWQARFMEEGVDGLLRDRTRPPGRPPVADDKASAVVALTLKPPPHEATHWTVRAMARAAGLAVSTVQRIWKAHGRAPHRWRQFKFSGDPAFAEKLHDVVGLYVSPPAHALVLSLDEKSQIQALDRTQPGLPLKKRRGATLTHDYKRHGTTTLFAALDVLTGAVFARNMQRHRHQEFIRFLNVLERDIPAGKLVHVILDNYAAHKHEKVRAWLDRHPRWTFHFTPTSSSWLNVVEGFFAILTRKRTSRPRRATGSDALPPVRRPRDTAAYFGLTSKRWQSGTSIDVKGRISKTGDPDVRRTLYEVASAMLTRFKGADLVKRWGLKLAKTKCHAKARVAVARKLAVIMYAMWRDGTTYVGDALADAQETSTRAAEKMQRLSYANS